MGVIKDPNDLFFTGYIEDELGLPENDPIEEEIPLATVEEPKPKLKYKSPSNKMKAFDEKSLLTKSKVGARKARRVENLKYLMSMVDKDDYEESNMVMLTEPRRVPYFTQFLIDPENMEMWQDFVLARKLRKKKRDEEKKEKEEKGDDVKDEEWEKIPDERSFHPAYTAAESFRRLDRSFRNSLRRKHIPLGLLEKLEDEVVTFFRDWPSSVFITEISSGFERHLLHQLCQFLSLHSRSKTWGGVKRTHIENFYDDFIPPETLLSKYIEEHIYHYRS